MRFRLASCFSLAGLGLLLAPMGCEAQRSLAWQTESTDDTDTQSTDDTDSDYKACWVFNHMNKSGGQTVKGLLKTWLARKRISPGLYDSLEWKSGAEQAESFLSMDHTLIWGAYAEGLRQFGVPAHCKWFTIFRHPVSRLVSAYYFCQRRFLDPLCAADVVRADEVDLLTFAQHWTNFGLRQFASAFVLPEEVMSSRLAQRCPDCPGWCVKGRVIILEPCISPRLYRPGLLFTLYCGSMSIGFSRRSVRLFPLLTPLSGS